MATTAGELLTLARQHADQIAFPTAAEAHAAVTALRYVATRLRQPHDHGTAEPSPGNVERLADACARTKASWPGSPGRLPDLVGVGCDALARQDLDGADERWAAIVRLAEVARGCVNVALRFPPYARVQTLQDVRRAAVAVERDAALRPSDRAAMSVLDRPIPDSSGMGHVALLDGIGLLQQALSRDMAHEPLPVAAAISAAAVAEDIALAAARIAERDTDTAGRHAPAAWQAVQAAWIRFEDGSRRLTATPSSSVEAAMRLADTVGRVVAADQLDPRTTAVLGAAAEQLPRLARQLTVATGQWVRHRSLDANANDLVRRDDLVPAMLTSAVVPANEVDLIPAVTAMRVAECLSTELADAATGRGGREHLTRERRHVFDTDVRWAERIAARSRALAPVPRPNPRAPGCRT